MVYEVEEPDAKDPNYDEVAQVSTRCPSPRLSVCLTRCAPGSPGRKSSGGESASVLRERRAMA